MPGDDLLEALLSGLDIRAGHEGEPDLSVFRVKADRFELMISYQDRSEVLKDTGFLGARLWFTGHREVIHASMRQTRATAPQRTNPINSGMSAERSVHLALRVSL
jgi:hypothetical protein